jgi:hypothetical protein
MAEVLMVYEHPVRDDTGRYSARSIGRRATDGMWEAWLEFVPLGGTGDVLVSRVETRQPERTHLLYWATGLTAVYLEGALRRTRDPVTVSVRVVPVPFSDAPAAREPREAPRAAPGPEPVLDPFEVGGGSLDVLRQELTALDRARLLHIIDGFDLNPAREDLRWMTDPQLAHFIVVAVELQRSAIRGPGDR